MSTHVSINPAAAWQESLFTSLGGWRICDDHNHVGIEAALACDVDLGTEVAKGAPATLRIWQSDQALVVSRRDVRSPNYAYAKQTLEREGWQVFPRSTGGSAVPQGPGSLQLSMLLPRSAALAYSLEEIYRRLCQPLQTALQGMGIHTDLGSVPDAFCDGRFNILVAGKKIAGTAQVWRANIARQKNLREGYVLAHASLLVAMDKQTAINAVNRFYQLLGSNREFQADAVATVRDALNRESSEKYLHDAHALVQDTRHLLVTACKDAVADYYIV